MAAATWGGVAGATIMAGAGAAIAVGASISPNICLEAAKLAASCRLGQVSRTLSDAISIGRSELRHQFPHTRATNVALSA